MTKKHGNTSYSIFETMVNIYICKGKQLNGQIAKTESSDF